MTKIIYKIRTGLISFALGFALFGIGLPASLDYEMNNKNVGLFKLTNGNYQLQEKLRKDRNNYYLVATFDGRRRKDIVSSININLASIDGKKTHKKLSYRGGKTINPTKAGWFGKKFIVGYFSVDNDKDYTIEISDINHSGQIEHLILSLHSNANRFTEAAVVFLSIILLLFGFIKIVIGLARRAD